MAIRIPSIEELKAAYVNPQTGFDPSKVTSEFATGMTLQDSIAQKKADRMKAEEELKKEINAAKILAAQKQKEAEFAANPTLQGAYGVAPVKGAEGMFDREKEKMKLAEEDTRQRNYVRQLYTDANGQSYAVLGKVDKAGNPVVVPVSAGEGQHQPFIPPTMPAEQVEKTGTFDTLAGLMTRLKDAVSTVNPQTKTPELTQEGKGYLGLIDAPSQKLKQFTNAADPAASVFYQTLQDLKNQIIYLRSGKQINEEEYKRLRAAMPNEMKGETTFLPDLANFERTFNQIRENRAKAFQQAGFRNPPPGIQGEQPAPSNPGSSGLTPEQRRARIAELKAKKAQGR